MGISVSRESQELSARTVDYFTADGAWEDDPEAARAGRDYTATRGTLSFDPGQRVAEVWVPIIDNGLLDGARNFRLVLASGPEGGLLIPPLVRIHDNELSPLPDAAFPPDAEYDASYRLVAGSNGQIVIGPSTRLNRDGSTDFSFRPAVEGFPIGVTGDGHLWLQNQSFPTAVRLAQLRSDGALEHEVIIDQFLTAVIAPNGGLYVARTTPDGREGLLRRLRANGVEDTTFHEVRFGPLTPGDSTAPGFTVSADGSILLYFPTLEQVNGEERRQLARLLGDGTLDTGFLVPPEVHYSIYSVVPLRDGKLVAARSRDDAGVLGGQPSWEVFGLNQDGSLNTGFKAFPVALWSSRGQVKLAGLNGVAWVFRDSSIEVSLDRLNDDGSVDPASRVSFDMKPYPCGPGAVGYSLTAFCVSQQGDALVGGRFRSLPDFQAGLVRVRASAVGREFRVVQRAPFHRPPGLLTLQVVRTGDTTLAASVRFATRDGDAVAGEDYARQEGSLVFAPLEPSKEIVLEMLPPKDRAPRHFWISLTEPSDGYAVAPSTRVRLASTVRIIPESLQIGERNETGWRSVNFTTEYAVPGAEYAVEGAQNGIWGRLILSSADPMQAYASYQRWSLRVLDDDGPGDRSASFFRVVALEP